MQRLLIVSNRLPINVTKGNDGEKWEFQLSSGGLVSALAGVQKTSNFVWIGWPGIDVELADRKLFSEILQRDYSSLPVFIDENTSNLHYNGFSNGAIWPLFHYLPADVNISEEQWEGYKRANQIFADYIAKIAINGDVIWIHDYHLLLLPEMLRKALNSKNKTVKIGFFLHIPFPTSEVYRVLPYRKEVLMGILNSDLIGFHTYDYVRHFLTSCTRILGSNSSPTSVEFNNRSVKIGAYPVGVEPERFEECLKAEATCLKIQELSEKYKGLKVIVGVERLDYIKGLTQKLLAFEEFLEDNPEFIGKIVLIQVAIPSRTDVTEYQKLQNLIFELIGRINGKFSSLIYSPVQFIYNSVNFNELVALYRLADICLVTSTRDGMNLVAYEYVATQTDKHGVLILSEFAGAAQSLNGAILINPWNINQIKKSLLNALNITDSQKINDHSHLLAYIKKFTSSYWGKTFVGDLLSFKQKSNSINLMQLVFTEAIKNPENLKTVILNSNSFSKIDDLFIKKLIIAEQTNSARISNDLKNFSKNSELTVYSFSSECKNSQLTKPDLYLGSFAENGAWFRLAADLDNWILTCPEFTKMNPIWNDQLIKILKFYTKRVPFSYVYVSEGAISWSFRNCHPKFSAWTSSELQMNLEKIIGHLPLKVIRLSRELKITSSSVDVEKICFDAIKTAAKKFEKIIFLANKNSELKNIAEMISNECYDIRVIVCVS